VESSQQQPTVVPSVSQAICSWVVSLLQALVVYLLSSHLKAMTRRSERAPHLLLKRQNKEGIPPIEQLPTTNHPLISF